MTTTKSTYRLNKLPKNVMTLNAFLELVELPPFWDCNNETSSLADQNEENIETRALDGACNDLGYKFNVNSWETQKECANCDGDGLVITGFDEETYENTEEDCQACDGTGWVDIGYETLFDTPEYEKNRSEVENDLYKGWKSAIESAMEYVADGVNLVFDTVEIKGDGKNTPMSQDGYLIRPTEGKTWKDVCAALVEIINGYGWFWFDSAKELKDVGPYATYQQAALAHLHYIQHYSEVYGGRSLESRYYDNLQDNLRNW